MTTLDRVFLAVSAVVLFVIAGFLVAAIMGSPVLVDWLRSPNLVLDGSIPALILVVVGIYLVILTVRLEHGKYIVYANELGRVRVSTRCIEGLIVESARKMEGTKDVRVRIVDVDNPKVSLNIQVMPDFNIPQLTEELQVTVKQYVKDTVGVDLEEVEIVVAGIAAADEAVVDQLP